MKGFKPQLLTGFGSGIVPDWEKILKHPIEDYLVSSKKDGVRQGNYLKLAKGRSLKPCKSIRVQEMQQKLHEKYKLTGVVESEFYAEGFTFPEIMHFYTTEDIASREKIAEYQREWEKTNGGTESYSAISKGQIVEKFWEFPGRTPEWLAEWHPELKFHIFDYFDGDLKTTKIDRYFNIQNIIDVDCEFATVLPQYEFDDLESLIEFCQEEIENGNEGAVIMHKHSGYKYGKVSLRSGVGYKYKDDLKQYDGVILSVGEGTQVKDGVEKTRNELGHSVTSGKKDDREPNGKAKGFKVLLEDGKEMVVSLKGYTDGEKVGLLHNSGKYIGLTIRFTGMPPVKENGVPRHAHFTKGNFRDQK
tara:strand:+ start:63070 stop:64149 length:1080 start_codon:yes stop_codon:yes gene_type:complete